MTDHVSTIVQAAQHGRLVAFCGAGVSLLPPSCAPGWWDIYVAAAAALADRLTQAFPELRARAMLDELLAPMSTQQLADLVFSRFAGPTFAELLQVVDVADPNENHRAIATLAGMGGMRGVVTTNFDTLIERAAAARDVRFAIAAPGIAAGSEAENHPVLVKVHGTTLEPASLIETTTHKAREISPTLRAAWRPKLKGAVILVLGYSGADLNFGAARAFFDDVLAAGCHIFWLYRPGSPPLLTPEVEAHTTLIEGQLPDLLREVLARTGEIDFETTETGRDARATLYRQMDTWSKGIHIGPWSAASFFFALSTQAQAGKNCDRLRADLLRIAIDAIPRFEPGSAIELADLAAAGFLGQVGGYQLQRHQLDDARAMLRASVNIYEAMHASLDSPEHVSSHDERRMNLASSWNNYAQACVLAGEINAALAAFGKALEHAYRGNRADSFLVSLGNILHYGYELRAVRRCLHLAQGAAAIADRIGAVQSSIELRSLMALYACDRQESWRARQWLTENLRLAKATRDENRLALTEIQLGECDLRAGRIVEGLEGIANALARHPKAVFFSRPVEEARRYLVALGITQKQPFVIRFQPAEVPVLAQRIEAERTRARKDGSHAFGGRHCAISDSSYLQKADGLALTRIGLLDFDTDSDAAAGVGCDLAEQLVTFGTAPDAGWVASNVLARPGLDPSTFARAHAVLARHAVLLGRPAEARVHLASARLASAEADIPMPRWLMKVGLWLEIQCEDAGAAVAWAQLLVDDVSGEPQIVADLVELLAQIESWGESMRPVSDVVYAALDQVGADPGAASVPRLEKRFSPLVPKLYSSEPADPDIEQIIHEAHRRLDQGDAEAALEALDRLGKDTLSDRYSGTVLFLQVQAFAAAHSIEVAEKVADSYRGRLLKTLSFDAMAQLELSLIWVYVRANSLPQAVDLIRRTSWIAELTDNPVNRASLQAWEALIPVLVGRNSPIGEWARSAIQSAIFLQLPMATLGRHYLVGTQPASSRSPEGEVWDDFVSALQSSESLDQVDQAIRTGIRRLRGAGRLSRALVARMRGDRSNWLLQHMRYHEAAQGYARTERTFRALGLHSEALNAKAGRARATSRSGRYDEAVGIFRQAIDEAAGGALLSNLLIGLGAAHLLEAGRRTDAVDGHTLRDEAIATLREAVTKSPLESADRANARLALARALGESGRQQEAVDAFDRAVAELAHIGSPSAKLLMNHRDEICDGGWDGLGLS